MISVHSTGIRFDVFTLVNVVMLIAAAGNYCFNKRIIVSAL